VNGPTRPGEPEHTIYVDGWRKALARLRHLEGEERRLLTELLAHVDAGWRHVRQMQLACERITSESSQNRAMRDVLAFLGADVVDTFRELALDAAALVPGWEGWEEAADPGDMDGDAGVFIRYLGVLRVAAASGELSSELRDVITSVSTELADWDGRLTRLLRTIDEVVVMPLLSKQDTAGLHPQNRLG
jgi:hypothetical protein